MGLNGFTSGPVVSREVAQDIVRQSFCGEEMDADFPWRGRFRLLVVIYLLATRHGFGMCGLHAGGVAVVTSESGQQSDLATGHQHTTSSAPFVCTQERLDRIKIHKLLRDPRRCRLPSSSSHPVLCTGFYQRPLFVVRFFVECARGQ